MLAWFLTSSVSFFPWGLCLQYTGQQLGSSLGVALIGAIVLSGLTSAFVTTIQSDQRMSAEVAGQVGVAVEGAPPVPRPVTAP